MSKKCKRCLLAIGPVLVLMASVQAANAYEFQFNPGGSSPESR